MKNLKKITYIIVSLILPIFLFFFSALGVRAETSVPDNFNQNLDLNRIYIYNVSAFNTTKPLENPMDSYNIFESPMPFMNIEFLENRLGILIANSTLYNVSNGEAAQNLLLGYNRFKSGFLIPISDFSNLTQEAYAQDEPPFMNATVSVIETSKTISFDFKQKTSLQQNTNCTYDKTSGLLIYTNSSFGNYTLEMTLINLPSFPSDSFSIPSFNLSIVIMILGTVVSLILINIY
jgi:hypothetical protein